MQQRFIILAMSVLVAGVGFGPARAADAPKPAPAAATTSQTDEGQAKPTPKAKAKKPKPVDINSASVEQLAKVPGLDKAHAMKIVAHRPFPTRAWLVTEGILSEAKYAEVKDYLVATPPAPAKAKK
jgi:competence protein ComEA